MLVVYYSARSGNTARFVGKLDTPALRLPDKAADPVPEVDEPYVLVTPTYGAGKPAGAVPRPVIAFLNNPDNRKHLVGVIAAGNTNFGAAYGLAADIVSAKTGAPVLHRFEVFGTPEDVTTVQTILDTLKEPR